MEVALLEELSVSVGGLAKTFTLHNLGGADIPVFENLDFGIRPGECVALTGPSGVGKSTFMRAIYANYRSSAGQLLVRHGEQVIDLANAEPSAVIDVRRSTLGYVSQFLRVIPRVPTLEIVMQPLLDNGWDRDRAEARARTMLTRLNLPESLWALPPATFSGGEQQRVNVARGFAFSYPILLLDEPTASLDPANRDVVIELIHEALAQRVAIIGIFHDAYVREKVATRDFMISDFIPKGDR
jgi:alpha-D-ribose 1-methylphosphonate 5-triphosphate synthase subunit PhnL